MFEIFITNLKALGILTALFFGSFSANTLLGLYQQVGLQKEEFSKEKFINGLTKAGIILIASFLLTTIVSLLPFGLAEMGIVLEEAVLESINITAFCGVIVTSIVRYVKDALTKFYTILGHQKEKEDDVLE